MGQARATLCIALFLAPLHVNHVVQSINHSNNNDFLYSPSPSFSKKIAVLSKLHQPCYNVTAEEQKHLLQKFIKKTLPTFAIAFLYLMAACSIRLWTLIVPLPQGTTTLVLPKHTVTFILVPNPDVLPLRCIPHYFVGCSNYEFPLVSKRLYSKQADSNNLHRLFTPSKR